MPGNYACKGRICVHREYVSRVFRVVSTVGAAHIVQQACRTQKLAVAAYTALLDYAFGSVRYRAAVRDDLFGSFAAAIVFFDLICRRA